MPKTASSSDSAYLVTLPLGRRFKFKEASVRELSTLGAKRAARLDAEGMRETT